MSEYTALLIDPFTKSISSVTIPRGEGELKSICRYMNCSIIDTVSPAFGESGDRIIVDDEGLFVENQEFFYVDGIKLAGKALYVGNFGSKFASPKMTAAELFSLISFVADPFGQWLDSFLDEKGIDLNDSFEFDNGGFALISVGAVIEAIRSSDNKTKAIIKEKLVGIDFINGDVMHFFRFLAQNMADSAAA